VIEATIKRCGTCDRTFTRETWAKLKLCGDMPTFDDSDRPITLELRNCACGSTLAIEKEISK
jgi:hypothetical protein